MLFSVLLLMAQSCNTGQNEDGSSDTTVILARDSLTEVGSFQKSNGELCKMTARVVIDYPNRIKNATSVGMLQEVYCNNVLNAPSGVTHVKDALKLFAQSIISQNTPSATRASNDNIDSEIDEIDIDYFETQVNVKAVYNDNRIITFCKEEILMKNGQVTSTTHRYVSIDLASMKRVSLSDIFSDESIDKLTQKLKSQLMDDKGVSNEDELNDLGYFNLPNLTVTDNFFFTDDGITWCYDPSVVAVASVGEPTVSIDYDDLKQLKCDKSLLDRF